MGGTSGGAVVAAFGKELEVGAAIVRGGGGGVYRCVDLDYRPSLASTCGPTCYNLLSIVSDALILR
jgi:hypothetical protein